MSTVFPDPSQLPLPQNPMAQGMDTNAPTMPSPNPTQPDATFGVPMPQNPGYGNQPPMPPVVPPPAGSSMQPSDMDLVNVLNKTHTSKAKDALTNALTGFVFSLGKGLEAQAQYPGQRGSMAGVGAALQAPQELQRLQVQRQAQQAAIADQAAQTKQRNAAAQLDALKSQTVPMTNADGSPMLTDPNDPNSVLMLPLTQATQLKRSQMTTANALQISNNRIADLDKRSEAKNDIARKGIEERNVLALYSQGLKEVPNDASDPSAGTHIEAQAPSEYSPAFRNKIEDDAMKNALIRAQADLATAKNDPNSPIFKQAQQRLQVLQQGMQLKAQEAATGKPLPQTDENRAVSAAMIIQLAPQIQQEIEKNSAKLGAIVGKGEDFMLKAGIKDPELRQLQVDLASIAPFVSQMHAARGTQGMIQEFGKVTSRLGEDPLNAVVAIKANAGIAQQVLDEIQAQHPNAIVTGSTKGRASAPTASPTAGPPSIKVRAPDGTVGTWDTKKGQPPKGFTVIQGGP